MKKAHLSHPSFSLLVFILSVLLPPALLHAGTDFFRDGKTDWTVRLLQPDDVTIRHAGEEFQRALKLISGADFPLTEDAKPVDQNQIVIGVSPQLAQTPDLIEIETRDGNLFLTGGSPRSALYAVYEFLRDELGARWLWPGEDGEFLPKRTTWSLPEIHRSFEPPIRYRGFHMCGDWYRVDDFHLWMSRNLLNSHRHGNHRFPDRERGFYRIYSNHNVFPPKENFETHPEYYALRNGRRLKCQVCLSSHECVVATADKLTEELKKCPDVDVLSLFLPDNQEYCQCEDCAKKSVSTAFFDFFNELTDILKERFPNLRFATLAYQGYLEVPDHPVRNAEFIEVATHGRCNVHLYGDAECERNAAQLALLKSWKETGTPIGNYAYEYDIFSHTHLFLPFFSVLADVVKMNHEIGSVICIPEVSLSPRTGPEEKVGTYANRVSQYVMGRLMVDPTLDWHDVLRDYCDCAFGPASPSVYEYFLALDARWNELKLHRGILGSPVGFAEEFLTPEVLKKAETFLSAAQDQLAGAADLPPAEKERFLKNVQREMALLGQWKAFLTDEDRAEAALTETPAENQKFSWTPDGITVQNLELPAELALTTGQGGEKWFFRVEADGTKSQWRVSALGVREEWSPDPVWSFTKDENSAKIQIPFASLALENPVTPETLWQFKLTEAEKSTPANAPWAGFSFSRAAQTGRELAYWTGTFERDEPTLKRFSSSMRECGWDVRVAKTGEEFLKLDPEVYWLRNPSAAQKLPPECWEKVRRDVEENGKLLVIISYTNFPLETVLNDPSFAVRISGIGSISLPERRCNGLVEDSWLHTPYELEEKVRKSITPAYFLKLAEREKWNVLTTMPKSSAELDAKLDYIALRPYGRGAVLLLSADPWLPLPEILENLNEYRKK